VEQTRGHIQRLQEEISTKDEQLRRKDEELQRANEFQRGHEIKDEEIRLQERVEALEMEREGGRPSQESDRQITESGKLPQQGATNTVSYSIPE
jgi:hypothetical protein